MATVPALTTTYTLEQAEEDIAQLRGQTDVSGEVQTFTDGSVVPNTPAASGSSVYSAGGQLKYVGFDGNAYSSGRSTVFTAGSQSIVSTSPVVVSGGGSSLSQNVVTGSYKFVFHLMCVPNGTGAGGNSRFRLNGPAFSAGSYTMTNVTNGATVARFDNTSGFGVLMPGNPMTSTLPVVDVVIKGVCTFTASAALSVSAALTGAGDAQYVIAIGSSMDLYPIT